MNNEKLIALAKEAGFDVESGAVIVGYYSDDVTTTLGRFAALVAAKEREKMVEEAARRGWAMKGEDAFEDCVQEIADYIARKP